MSYEVKFKKPTDAMRHAMAYNAAGVRHVLKEARKSKRWNRNTFDFGFAFVGVQGYPVKCFYDCMLKKGLAIATADE